MYMWNMLITGDLEHYDAAVTKCEVHMDAVNKERKVMKMKLNQNQKINKGCFTCIINEFTVPSLVQ